MKVILFIAVFALSSVVFATKTDVLKVSLLTCSTGPDLHAAFGHTAIRIIDEKNDKDHVFDYGIFDWDTPNFLVKFLSGELQYKLSRKTFDRFFSTYEKENRGIIERQINLRPEDALALYLVLERNHQPENRYYDYEFFKANCTTMARDVILEANGRSIDAQMPDITFREGLHQCLEKKPWTQLGVDIILGPSADRQLTYRESMFLPHLLDDKLSAYPSAIEEPQTLVKDEEKVLLESPQEESPSFFVSPTFLILLLGALILILEKVHRKTATIFSSVILVVAGMIGILILTLWFGSRHESFAGNFNIIWANPVLIAFPFLRTGKIKYRSSLSILVVLLSFLVLAIFGLLPQEFNGNVLLLTALITGIVLSHALGYRSAQSLEDEGL